MPARSLFPSLLLLVLALLSGCAYLPSGTEPPRVHLVGLQLTQVDVFEQRYRLKLRIQNPNDFALNIRGLDFRVEVNGEQFAEGVSSQTLAVPGFGEALTEVEVSSSLWSLARQFRDRTGAPEGIAYRLHGRVSLEGVALPVGFESTGEFGFAEPRR
ncbi:MAG: LEA type 2 family protein [Gammaproteobacteria bacterium]|nr:LEA type 2 family protein [Gammaproteobacteria bacterium]MDX5374822.1 LEA type 2 family protein [Gammaproteobacteria bacterium]